MGFSHRATACAIITVTVYSGWVMTSKVLSHSTQQTCHHPMLTSKNISKPLLVIGGSWVPATVELEVPTCHLHSIVVELWHLKPCPKKHATTLGLSYGYISRFLLQISGSTPTIGTKCINYKWLQPLWNSKSHHTSCIVIVAEFWHLKLCPIAPNKLPTTLCSLLRTFPNLFL